MQKRFFGWRCAVGCFLIAFCHSGIFSCLPALYPFFLEKLHTSLTLLSFSMTISTVSGTLAALIAAPLLDRLGARRMFFLGTISAVGLLLLLAAADRIIILWIAMALGGITMSFGLRAASVAVINAWFIEKRASLLGVIFAGMTLGGSAFLAATGRLIAPLGQRGMFLLFAAAVGLLCFGSEAFLIRDDPESCGQRPLGAQSAEAAAEPAGKELSGAEIAAIRRSRTFLLLAAAMILTAVTAGAFTSYGTMFLVTNGYSQERAASVVSLIPLCGTGASVLLGVLADKKGTRAYTAAALGCYVLGLAFAILWGSVLPFGPLLIPVVLLCSFGTPALSIGATVTPTLFGRRAATSVNSRLIVFTTAGSALCSFVGGALYDAAGSFLPFLALSAVLLGCAWLLYRSAFRRSAGPGDPV
ncbi:MAG: MFS transporter [Oscillospiraceae bacterium]|nr:MFS transporter [Oscillospiraceae bacterium]